MKDFSKYETIFRDLSINKFIVSTKDDEYGFHILDELEAKGFIIESQKSVFKLSQKGFEVVESGSYQEYLRKLNNENNKSEKIKELEAEKTQREIEKLKYEESIRGLTEDIQRLSQKNLKLQNLQIIYTFIGVIGGFIISILAEKWLSIIQLIIKYLWM
ncbi:hypothetical protein [Runella slithyformis]|uniref:Uncharacterized protein n=1 Tax=Runella slithyformis (strain ATCC 29530 / DSM 19594 / LMG 11500 / NCIMB 11436 / LSU 4) TaxID=761193 RepID=A0A7U3ZL50_RUNSL|nr:hypothetical protein [Runella slithyformis]AEI49227.1 hypothetical protein Runsl_2838 [Runella slithyformis DSM 19594]